MNNYIKTFEKLGCEYFQIANDDLLKEWGHSEEAINEIKERSVKSVLRINQRSLKLFKVLNELNGGINVLPDDTISDKFELGIKRYGFDSEFRKEYERITAQLRHHDLDAFFTKWEIDFDIK